ncbi:hypothetical protein HKK54_25465 [Pseudomonas sp. ADAK13]|nr:hypothetical protein HKK54_25465 [Pseudomonas sp. ADAK13]
MSTFHQQHPAIEIQVATTTRPLTEFDGHFDVALQSTRRASGMHRLVFTAADEVFPVCSPHYLAAGQALSVDELTQCTLLHHRATPPHLMEWDSWLLAVGHALEGNAKGAVFDSYPLMLQAAVEGHGIAMGWQRTAGRLIDNGTLVRPCAESVALPDALSVFRQQGAGDTAEVRALVEWLAEELR